MSIRTEAEENLRVIRSLMEKATVYRAISAPGALAAGLCGVAFAIGGRWLVQPGNLGTNSAPRFLILWLGGLLISSSANLLLLAIDARRRGEPFLSSGMRLALRAMLPALLGGGAVAWLIFALGPVLVTSFWVLFYGISLLAASHFAPKSICWLGRAFFAAGIALLLGGFVVISDWEKGSQALAAHDIMGATFGIFHLAYAACIWPRGAGMRTDA